MTTNTSSPGCGLTAAQMKAQLMRYLNALNTRDKATLTALYADDARIEDPVGTPAIQGRPAIAEFYNTVLAYGVRLRLTAPLSASHGNAAAMAFEASLMAPDGSHSRIQVIDVMTFNTVGEITSMKAYWGPDDVHTD